jgi:histidinol-phosphate aminotransferase
MSATADAILDLATPGVRGLQPYQPGKPLSELEREYGITGAIKLASNESPLGPAPAVREAIAAAIGDIERYPDGSGHELKQAIALRLGVGPESITLGNGSNDVLELVARAFVSPGQEVVYSQYAFAVYPIACQAAGGRAVVTPARDWGHDLEAMGEAVGEHTRVVFIANPNNPTGTWVEAAAVERLLERVPRHVVVVVDEAYTEYVADPAYPNCVPWVAHFPNLVVTRTFSKAYGLAGLRVGYAVSQPALAEVLNRVRQPFNVNSLAMVAACAALRDEGHLARAVEVNRQGLRQLTAGLQRLGLSWIPSVGNFVAVDLGRPAAPVYEGLLRQGVIVRPVAGYGMPDHLRVSVGLEAENRRFLAALEQVLAW